MPLKSSHSELCDTRCNVRGSEPTNSAGSHWSSLLVKQERSVIKMEVMVEALSNEGSTIWKVVIEEHRARIRSVKSKRRICGGT